ncbi:unnamed protein product, partial [Trichogramma brassicae]
LRFEFVMKAAADKKSNALMVTSITTPDGEIFDIPAELQELDPLHDLLRKDREFKWTEECQKSFDEMKKILCSQPVLTIFDSKLPIRIYTDASLLGLGAILKQIQENGEEKPVGYFSKKLNSAQKKKKATFLECLAIKECLQYWQHLLLGRKFKVITDHKPTTMFRNSRAFMIADTLQRRDDDAQHIRAARRRRHRRQPHQIYIIYETKKRNSVASLLALFIIRGAAAATAARESHSMLKSRINLLDDRPSAWRFGCTARQRIKEQKKSIAQYARENFSTEEEKKKKSKETRLVCVCVCVYRHKCRHYDVYHIRADDGKMREMCNEAGNALRWNVISRGLNEQRTSIKCQTKTSWRCAAQLHHHRPDADTALLLPKLIMYIKYATCVSCYGQIEQQRNEPYMYIIPETRPSRSPSSSSSSASFLLLVYIGRRESVCWAASLQFSREPQDLLLLEPGRSGLLECEARDGSMIDQPVISWRTDDGQPINFIGDKYRTQLPNGSLYIRSANEESIGSYQCLATVENVGAIASRTAVVKLASLAVFDREPQDTMVYTGQIAYLSCKLASGAGGEEERQQRRQQQRVDIQWLKDEQPLVLDESRMTILPSGALEIDDVMPEDVGSYRCNASGFGQFRLSNKAQLTLQSSDVEEGDSAPVFVAKPFSQVAVERSQVTLECAANGSPKPEVFWLKDGKTIDLSSFDSRYQTVAASSLLIKDLNEDDTGSYQCRAANSIDTLDAVAELSVQVAPRFIKRPQDKEASESQDLEFECEIYGKPQPSITWLKNGERIKLSNYWQLINGYNLRINGLLSIDAGIFQCMGSNAAGSVQASARLTILKPKKKDRGKVTSSSSGGSNNNNRKSAAGTKKKLSHKQLSNSTWQHPSTLLGHTSSAYTPYPSLTSGGAGGGGRHSSSSSSDDAADLFGNPFGGSRFPSSGPSSIFHDDDNDDDGVDDEDEEDEDVGGDENDDNDPENGGGGDNSDEQSSHDPAVSDVDGFGEFGEANSKPSVPRDLSAGVIGSRFIALKWQEPESTGNLGDIHNYLIYYKQERFARERQERTQSKETTVTISGLQPGTTYYFYVVANVSDSIRSPPSKTLQLTTESEPNVPSQPLNLKGWPTSSERISLSWDEPALINGRISSYLVTYAEGDNEEVKINSTKTSLELDNLLPYKEYNIWVQAVNDNGPGASTEEIKVRTFGAAPSAPPNVTAEAASSSSVIVRWEPPSEGQNGIITGYKIRYRQFDRRNHPVVITTEGNARMHTIAKLEKNVPYEVRVCAFNVNGTGPWSDWLSIETYEDDLSESEVPSAPTNLRNSNSDYVITLRAKNEAGEGLQVYANVRTIERSASDNAAPLQPPVGLKADVMSHSTVVLYWTDSSLSKNQYVTDKRYYVVRYTSYHRSNNPKYKYENATDLNCMIHDLKPNTEYEFSVKVVKGRRESQWSMVALNKTLEAKPASSPRDLTVQGIDDHPKSVLLRWQPPKQSNGDINGYTISYTTDNTKNERDWKWEAVVGDINEYVLKAELQPSTTYYFRIQARNTKGYGPFSTTISYTTQQTMDGRGISNFLIYIIIGCTVLVLAVTIFVVALVCCRRGMDVPDGKKGYLKDTNIKTNIKPPDLWIHHDQMELKALEKTMANGETNTSATTSNTLPRSSQSEYNPDSVHGNSSSLDKRTYIPSYMAIATATPIVNSSMSQQTIHSSCSDMPSLRPSYARTVAQYSLSRAHITLEPTPESSPDSCNLTSAYESLQPQLYTSGGPQSYNATQFSSSTYGDSGQSATGTESNGGVKRLQGHPLKSFSVPAPPPQSAPSTPAQQKHGVRSALSGSPYKKATSSSQLIKNRLASVTGTTHTPEEIERLKVNILYDLMLHSKLQTTLFFDDLRFCEAILQQLTNGCFQFRVVSPGRAMQRCGPMREQRARIVQVGLVPVAGAKHEIDEWMPAGQAAQLSSPGARRGGGSVSAGAERACPATAASSGGAYTGCHLGGTQRSSVEDKGALRARPGWHTQLSAQDRCCRAYRHLLAGVHDVPGDRRFSVQLEAPETCPAPKARQTSRRAVLVSSAVHAGHGGQDSRENHMRPAGGFHRETRRPL